MISGNAFTGCRGCLCAAIVVGIYWILPARVQADGGVVDRTFGTNGLASVDFGGAFDEVDGIALQSDGRIVALGSGGTSNRCAMARFLPNGQLDTSFSGDGKLIFEASAGSPAVAVLPSGHLVAAMPCYLTFWGFQLWRLNFDGSPDLSFGVGGVARVTLGQQPRVGGLAVQRDGKIVVCGSDYFGGWDFVVVRFLPDGTIDSGFGTGGVVQIDFSRPGITGPTDRASSLALQPDGKILVGGFTAISYSESSGNRISAIARLLPNGQLDSSFGAGGKVVLRFDTGPYPSETVQSLVVLPGGRILACNAGGIVVAFRLNPDGSLDSSFASAGAIPSTPAFKWGAEAALDASGRILVRGSAWTIARYDAHGVLDPTFGVNGVATASFTGDYQGGTDLQLMPDGNILLGGRVGNANVNTNMAVIRYSGGTPLHQYTFQAGSVDALASSQNGKNWSITDGGIDINVYRSSIQKTERRGILEFNLAGLPADASILSAALDLNINVITTSGGSLPALQFYGYPGNGVMEPADALLSADLIAATPPIAAIGPVRVDLASSWISTLLQSGAPWLGLTAYQATPGLQAGFQAAENPDTPPRLSIVYRDPTPAADMDGDADVDDQDLGVLHLCTAGPSVAYPAGCELADLDHDSDVDQDDFGIYQRCYSGRGGTEGTSCRN